MRFPPIARPSFRTGAELTLGAVLVSAVLWQTHVAHAATKRAGKIALQADTLRASLDSSRNLGIANATIRKLAGDSLVFTQRQVIQVTQRADSLDRALHLERTAKTQLVARVHDLETKGTAAVTADNPTDTATRRATFTGRQEPYTYRAAVALPAPPAAGTIALSVSLDSIPIEVRPGCSDPNPAGIRSAFVTVKAPAWAPVAVGRVEQDPGVCRSPALEPAHGDGRAWWRRLVDRAGVDFGYGATLNSDGKIYHGPTVVAGVKLWP